MIFFSSSHFLSFFFYLVSFSIWYHHHSLAVVSGLEWDRWTTIRFSQWRWWHFMIKLFSENFISSDLHNVLKIRKENLSLVNLTKFQTTKRKSIFTNFFLVFSLTINSLRFEFWQLNSENETKKNEFCQFYVQCCAVQYFKLLCVFICYGGGGLRTWRTDILQRIGASVREKRKKKGKTNEFNRLEN